MLSLVLPAVPVTEIASLLQLLPAFFPEFEIILPPTEDQTIIELAQANSEKVRFMPGSLVERVQAAKGEFLMFQRGVGAAELEKFAHYAGKAEIVTGFSRQKQSNRFLSSLLFRTSLREVGGFMLCKSWLVGELNLTPTEKPLYLALEILGKSERKGYRIIEIELAKRPSPPESLASAEIASLQRIIRNYKPTQFKRPSTLVPSVNLYMVSGAVVVGLVWLTRKLVRRKKK